jgi:Tat protein secretion system quality control protein TatD with DNase activity
VSSIVLLKYQKNDLYLLVSAFGVTRKLHCVKAFGPIVDFLRSQKDAPNFPPVIVMHSFSGAKDMVECLRKIPKIGSRIYFAFSTVINVHDSAPSARLLDAIAAGMINDLKCRNSPLTNYFL